MRKGLELALALTMTISCGLSVLAEEAQPMQDAKTPAQSQKSSAEQAAAASTPTATPATTPVETPAANIPPTAAPSASTANIAPSASVPATSTGTYKQHFDAGKQLVKTDKDKGITELKAALDEADRAHNDFQIAEVCNEIANAYMAKNDIITAADYAKRAKDSAIKVLFADPKTANLANELARNQENGSIWIAHVMKAEFAAQRKDYATAENEYQAAINKANEYSKDGMPMATALSGLGKTYVAEGKLSEAEPILRKAIDLCEKNWTPVTASTASDGADAMDHLVIVLEKTGRKAEADKLASRSKKVRENKSFSI